MLPNLLLGLSIFLSLVIYKRSQPDKPSQIHRHRAVQQRRGPGSRLLDFPPDLIIKIVSSMNFSPTTVNALPRVNRRCAWVLSPLLHKFGATTVDISSGRSVLPPLGRSHRPQRSRFELSLVPRRYQRLRPKWRHTATHGHPARSYIWVGDAAPTRCGNRDPE